MKLHGWTHLFSFQHPDFVLDDEDELSGGGIDMVPKIKPSILLVHKNTSKGSVNT